MNYVAAASAALGCLLIGGVCATSAAILHAVVAGPFGHALSYRRLAWMTLWGGAAMLACVMVAR
jgi:hypothetical protein